MAKKAESNESSSGAAASASGPPQAAGAGAGAPKRPPSGEAAAAAQKVGKAIDLIGRMPRNLAASVLTYLDVSEVGKLKAVSKDWARTVRTWTDVAPGRLIVLVKDLCEDTHRVLTDLRAQCHAARVEFKKQMGTLRGETDKLNGKMAGVLGVLFSYVDEVKAVTRQFAEALASIRLAVAKLRTEANRLQAEYNNSFEMLRKSLGKEKRQDVEAVLKAWKSKVDARWASIEHTLDQIEVDIARERANPPLKL